MITSPFLPFSLLAAIILSPILGRSLDTRREIYWNQRCREISGQLEKITGWKFKQPIRAKWQDISGFNRYLDRQIDQQVSPPLLENFGEIIRLLGLHKGTPLTNYRGHLKSLLTSQTLAYFDPQKSEFYYLYPEVNEDLMLNTMAHELVHGLQHQHFDLNHFLLEAAEKHLLNDDQIRARQAFIEGQATLLMLYWSFDQNQRVFPTAPEMAATLDRIPRGDLATIRDSLVESVRAIGFSRSNQEGFLKTVRETPAFLLTSLYFPYFRGTPFAFRISSPPHSISEEPFSATLPESTEQILHPDKWHAQELPTAIRLATSTFPFPEDYRWIYENCLGEFGIQQCLEEYGLHHSRDSAAFGWKGDFFQFFKNPKDQRLILLTATLWDSPEDAREFFAAQDQLFPLKHQAKKVFITPHYGEDSLFRRDQLFFYLWRHKSWVFTIENILEGERPGLKKYLEILNSLG